MEPLQPEHSLCLLSCFELKAEAYPSMKTETQKKVNRSRKCLEKERINTLSRVGKTWYYSPPRAHLDLPSSFILKCILKCSDCLKPCLVFLTLPFLKRPREETPPGCWMKRVCPLESVSSQSHVIPSADIRKYVLQRSKTTRALESKPTF